MLRNQMFIPCTEYLKIVPHHIASAEFDSTNNDIIVFTHVVEISSCFHSTDDAEISFCCHNVLIMSQFTHDTTTY